MRDRRVGAVLVTGDDRRLLGIFTGRDAVCRVLAEGKDPAKTTLAEVMTRAPYDAAGEYRDRRTAAYGGLRLSSSTRGRKRNGGRYRFAR